MGSLVPVYLDALVTALQAAPALQSPVRVFDGPTVVTTPEQQHVVVGYDGDETEGAVVDWTNEQVSWDVREETFTIVGCVVAWGGDVDNKTRRDQAFTLLAAVENVVRNGIDIGLDQPAIADFIPGQLLQEQANYGMQAKILFGVRYSNVEVD